MVEMIVFLLLVIVYPIAGLCIIDAISKGIDRIVEELRKLNHEDNEGDGSE